MEVIFLGLASAYVDLQEVLNLKDTGAQLWTLNDWYQPYGEILVGDRKPDLAFNVHAHLGQIADGVDDLGHDRKMSIWAEECHKRGVATTDMREHNRKFYYGQLPAPWYQCTFGYMFPLAWSLGATAIHLRGCPFVGRRERQIELANVRSGIEMSRNRGIAVTCPHEDDWNNREHVPFTVMGFDTPYPGF